MALSQTSAEDGNGYLLVSGDGTSGSAAPAATLQAARTALISEPCLQHLRAY